MWDFFRKAWCAIANLYFIRMNGCSSPSLRIFLMLFNVKRFVEDYHHDMTAGTEIISGILELESFSFVFQTEVRYGP
jgi:hypothetical protein